MIKKATAGIIITALIGFFIYANYVYARVQKSYVPQQNLNAPIEIPPEATTPIAQANTINKPQVILFYVDWCGYCRKFMPVFGEFAKKYQDKYTFSVVNCDSPENKEIIENFHIQGFPMLFIVDNEIGHKFTVNMAATADKKIFTEELEAYLKVREKIHSK